MNLRQKAKLFKKLYENGLPKKPYPVVYASKMPRHFRIEQFVDMTDISCAQDNTQMLKTHIENKIFQLLKPLIWENLKTEKDFYTGKMMYRLDIWIGSQERED